MDNALSLISEALSHAGEDQQLMERLAHLEDRRITPDKELPPMEFLFRLFGKPCFPRGELVGLTGKPKSGKTFISSILMTLCFREEVLTMLRASPEQLRVLWYDTEQSDESTQDILRNRIVPMLFGKVYGSSGKVYGSEFMVNGDCTDETSINHKPSSINPFPSEMFHIFNVRQDMWRERLPLLEAAIERFKPDLVILDGIRDLINDINDGVLAQDTVERLMHLASEQHCCIACILHQNKSAEDKNLRGWIGTELTHKAFEVYECEKSDDRIFSFCQKLTRKYDILDTLKYIVDEQGIPQLASIENVLESEQRQRQQNNSSRPELNRSYIIDWDGNKPVFDLPTVFADAMPEQGKLYIAKDMQQEVMKLTNITSPYFYNTLREQALKLGLVIKTNDEHGYVAYYRPMPEVQTVLPSGQAAKPEQMVQEVQTPQQLNLFNDSINPEPLTLNQFDSPGDAPF